MQDANLEPYDIEVELTLFPPEEGGRNVGFPSTFNGPHLYFDHCEWLARFTLSDRERLNPGETARVLVTFFYQPHALYGRLHLGTSFLLHEGYHAIGKGRILSLLNFEKHAEQAKRQAEEGKDTPTSLISPLPWSRSKHKKRRRKKT